MLKQSDRHPHYWIVERLGRSGTRYKLAFRGRRFRRLSVLTPYEKGFGRPLYWKVLWDSGTRQGGALTTSPRPRSKRILEAFDDLGMKGTMQAFIVGQHFPLRREA